MVDADGVGGFIEIQDPDGHGHLLAVSVRPETDQLIVLNVLPDFVESIYRCCSRCWLR
ncbi:hypothetical protein D3C81_2248820 [compost metagenome]